jgi:uracil-DNA glycosylase
MPALRPKKRSGLPVNGSRCKLLRSILRLQGRFFASPGIAANNMT